MILRIGQVKQFPEGWSEKPTESMYSSSDPAIASVDGTGVITALAVGTVTIVDKAKFDCGGVYEGKVEVEVKPAPTFTPA